MKPVAFDYARAGSVEEVLDLLAEAGEDAALLAGGMSLGPMLNFRAAMPGLVIDLNQVPDLDGVAINGAVTTGAMLRQARSMKDAALMAAVPLLNLALPWVGHMQTRSRGTFGGSVAHADPSAEIPLCLVTLGGQIMLASKSGAREVPAREFFEGVLTTARREDEMIAALEWPNAGPRQGFAFTEEAQRHGDFALTAAAAWVALDDTGNIACGALGLGGVEDRPVATDLDDWAGAKMDEATAADIAATVAAAADAMDDHVADARFRTHLARVLGAKVLRQAAVGAGE